MYNNQLLRKIKYVLETQEAHTRKEHKIGCVYIPKIRRVKIVQRNGKNTEKNDAQLNYIDTIFFGF